MYENGRPNSILKAESSHGAIREIHHKAIFPILFVFQNCHGI